MGKRTKPKSPEQILAERAEQRRKDFEAAGLDPMTAGLAAYADVRTTRTGQKHGRTGAWRSNVFNLLLERKTITQGHQGAALQLAETWAVWKGLDGKAEGNGEFVDNGRSPPDQRCLVSDRQVRAGKDVTWVMGQLQPLHRKVLEAFMVATVEEDRAMSWRGIMQRLGVTEGEIKVGDDTKERQAWTVRSALDELQVVFHQPKAKAA